MSKNKQKVIFLDTKAQGNLGPKILVHLDSSVKVLKINAMNFSNDLYMKSASGK